MPERIPTTTVLENIQGRVIGFVTIVDGSEVEQLYVDSDYCGRGAGSMLLEEAED